MKIERRLAAAALTFVTLTAVGAPTAVDEASALGCCSTCDADWAACYDGCGGDPACELGCNVALRSCVRHCSPSC